MDETSPSKKILFICAGNESRSQIAEAFARMYGGNGLEAYSAGLRPVAEVDSGAVDFMLACGYDLSAHFPKGLGDIPPEVFDVAVMMDDEAATPTPPARARRWVVWDVPPPTALSAEEFQAMGVLIEEKVRGLLGGL